MFTDVAAGLRPRAGTLSGPLPGADAWGHALGHGACLGMPWAPGADPRDSGACLGLATGPFRGVPRDSGACFGHAPGVF